MTTRPLNEKDLAYDRISDRWDKIIANYDTSRRVEVLVDDFLGSSRIRGKTCLEAGCGLGAFSERIRSFQPAQLSACDIAPSLVARLGARFPDIRAFPADLLALEDATRGEQFDVVLSSEVIEHTPDPRQAVMNLARAVVPGGVLALSVPNRRWIALLHLAEAARLRPHYQGYENWVSPAELLAWIRDAGLTVLRAEGIHTVPWQFLPKPFLRRLDRRLRESNYGTALNLAVLATRA